MLALALCLMPGEGLAQTADLAQRLTTCGACHGVDGNAQLPNIPSLAGQPSVFLENQLVLIREGIREIAAMGNVLTGISDREITALARHYANQKVKSPPLARDVALFTRGQLVSEQRRCGTCHLSNYAGREQMPRLAAQREDFLLHSMREFAANRATGRDTVMAATLYGLDDGDLVALAHYLSRIGP